MIPTINVDDKIFIAKAHNKDNFERGDILVFKRPGGGGHVGFYVGEDDKCYHVLGGNQSNEVSVARLEKSRCLGIRRCDWKVAQPKTVKKYFVTPSGEVSTNEA